MSHPQLTLNLQVPVHDTLANFFVGNNLELINHLLEPSSHTAQLNLTFIVGESGSGRSHLLHGLCSQALDQQKNAFLIASGELEHLSPQMLEGLENMDLVCIDDFEHMTGNSEWEFAMFDFINRVIESGNCRLVITANQSPLQLSIHLPDLASRLSWGATFKLDKLAEDEQIQVLQQRAKQRGFTLSKDVAQFMLTRTGRGMRSLMDSLDTLDKASLAAQRKLTIPFVKQVLNV